MGRLVSIFPEAGTDVNKPLFFCFVFAIDVVALKEYSLLQKDGICPYISQKVIEAMSS